MIENQDINNIQSIKNKFESLSSDIYFQIANTSNRNFDRIQTNKWNVAQNFEHLIASTDPVATALRLPKFILKAFGTPNRPCRDYAIVVKKYKLILENGGKATGKYIPDPDKTYDKQKMLKKWLDIKFKILSRLDNWREEDLEAYLLPHPLMGKMMVREILFFTIFHSQHHLAAIRALASNQQI